MNLLLKLIYLSLSLTLVLLTGCGGGGSDEESEELKKIPPFNCEVDPRMCK